MGGFAKRLKYLSISWIYKIQGAIARQGKMRSQNILCPLLLRRPVQWRLPLRCR